MSLRNKTLVIYFDSTKKTKQVIKLFDTFEGSPKDIAWDISNGNYHSFEII